MTQNDNSVRKAGYYELLEAKLYKLDKPDRFIDIKLMIYEWSLNESMNDGFLSGSIDVLDGVGLFYNFLDDGLKGEEEIEIVYKDYYDNERSHKFFVYSVSSISPVNPSNETALNYKLYFVSKHKFYTDRFTIRKSYSDGLISDYVGAMWEEFWVGNDDSNELSFDDIVIEETEGPQSLVIPNYKPEQAMHMLARKAYSAQNATHTYRFFQNRDRYYFATNEEMTWFAQEDTIPIFALVQNPDNTGDGQDYKMLNYISIKFSDHVNTMRDMIEGAYYRSTTELDFMNRTALVTEYRYLDEYEDYQLPDIGKTRSKHTKEFVDKHFTDFTDTLVLKDYPAIGAEGGNEFVRPHTYYNQIYNKKPVNFYHHNTEKTEMMVYGRNDLVAGNIIELEILKSLGDIEDKGRAVDTERSGNYLVESIENVFREDMYYQKLTMSKSGLKGQPEPAREYEREPQTISEFLENKRDTFELVGEPPQSTPPAGNAAAPATTPPAGNETPADTATDATDAATDDATDTAEQTATEQAAEASTTEDATSAEGSTADVNEEQVDKAVERGETVAPATNSNVPSSLNPSAQASVDGVNLGITNEQYYNLSGRERSNLRKVTPGTYSYKRNERKLAEDG